jgi:DNA polymerase
MVEEPEDFEEIEEPKNKYDGEDSLEAVAADVGVCKACGLAVTRKHSVPGEGSTHPLVMVIGEGPGADEDAAGRPFVGRAGQLLDKMLGSIALTRGKNCYIANMVKCRPPQNRDPGTDEINACYSFLERQIILLNPALILCAGRVATQNLLKTSKGINALRGQFAEFKIGELTIPVLPTFHPSAILRDESLKRPAWEDLKLLRSRLAEMNL